MFGLNLVSCCPNIVPHVPSSRVSPRTCGPAVAVAEVKPLDGGAEAVYRLTYETEGEPKPCCVADLVFRYYN